MPVPGMDEQEASERLALKLSLVNVSPDITSAFLLDLWRQVGGEGLTIRNMLAAQRGSSAALTIRGLLWLAKLGLLRLVDPARRQ